MSVYARLQGTLVIDVNDHPAIGFVEAPDGVTCLWEFSASTWKKSAALLAIEASESERLLKRSNVSSSISTLRTWADEAAADATAWDAATTAEKLVITKRLLSRTSTFWKRFADFYEGHQFKP
jgi:hypothetical protein